MVVVGRYQVGDKAISCPQGPGQAEGKARPTCSKPILASLESTKCHWHGRKGHVWHREIRKASFSAGLEGGAILAEIQRTTYLMTLIQGHTISLRLHFICQAKIDVFSPLQALGKAGLSKSHVLFLSSGGKPSTRLQHPLPPALSQAPACVVDRLQPRA